jgi:hypothetical protein
MAASFQQLRALCSPEDKPVQPVTEPEVELAAHIAGVVDSFKCSSEQQTQALTVFVKDWGICHAFMKILRSACIGSSTSNKARHARSLVCVALQSIYAQFHPDCASLTDTQANACYKFATSPMAASDYTTRPSVADAANIDDTWRTFFTSALQAPPTQEEIVAAAADVATAAATAGDTIKQQRTRATQSVPNSSARTDSHRFVCPCVFVCVCVCMRGGGGWFGCGFFF